MQLRQVTARSWNRIDVKSQSAIYRWPVLGSLWLAGVAACAQTGCTIPTPFGFGRSVDQSLESLTADGKKLGPAPELVDDASPYPTAVRQGSRPAAGYTPAAFAPAAATPPIGTAVQPTIQQQAAAPAPVALPLQGGAAQAIKLERSQLAGRLPPEKRPEQAPPLQPPQYEAYSPVIPATSASSAYPNGMPAIPQNAAAVPAGSIVPNWQTAALNGDPTALMAAAAPSVPPSIPLPNPVVANSPVATTPAANPIAATQVASIAPAASAPPVSAPAANPPPAATLAASPANSTASTPVSVPASDAASKPESEPLEALCQKHIAALEREIRERTDRKEEAELPALRQKLRLLQLISDRTDDAVDKVEQLPPAEREAFKQMMFALSTWLSPDDAKRTSARNAKILRSLQEVNNQLSAVSKLDLSNLMFCEKVESFGWYSEFSRAEFTPKQQVILYVEVRNFAAEEKTATAFETELQGRYQIYDAAGNLVDERELPLDREVCRNYRRDYFLAYRIYLPSDLSPGKYRLELTIEDLKAKQDFKGRKQGEAMIEFSIKN